MLDGRIDTQGTIADLRAQDVLETITTSEAVEVQAKEIVAAIDNDEIDASDDGKKSDNVDKKPRKLVKDEHRELGGVKWSIYNSYLKASWVLPSLSTSNQCFTYNVVDRTIYGASLLFWSLQTSY